MILIYHSIVFRALLKIPPIGQCFVLEFGLQNRKLSFHGPLSENGKNSNLLSMLRGVGFIKLEMSGAEKKNRLTKVCPIHSK